MRKETWKGTKQGAKIGDVEAKGAPKETKGRTGNKTIQIPKQAKRPRQETASEAEAKARWR